MKFFGLILTILFSSNLAWGQTTLSPVALYKRCFGQLTQQRISPNDPILSQVENGQITATNGCMQILNKANLNSAGRISDINDDTSRAVLHTMHNLHSSWFDHKDFVDAWIMDYIDSSSPGLYFTKAMFNNSTPISYAVTTTDNLVPDRTNNDPQFGPKSENVSWSSAPFGFGSGSFAAKGDLLGIKTVNNYVLTENAGTIDLGVNFGAGLLGTQAYLIQNTKVDGRYKADGGVRMPRQWGRAVFKDLLCRDLPVIRIEDATPFVKSSAESSVPFRQASACVRCHASMDRMTASIRGFTHALGSDNRFIGDARYAAFHPVNQPAESEWPFNSDSLYANRPPNGVFYFRDYKGMLHNENIVGLDGLGTKLSQMEDFYVCAAKRYYHYFTGINVFIGDEQDPSVGYNPTSGDVYHQQIVIQLGQNLMNHQDPKRLIEEIFNLPSYKTSDFEASNTGM